MDNNDQQADNKERFENYLSSGLPLTHEELIELVTSSSFWWTIAGCIVFFIACCCFFYNL